jgi:hypothetical protein
MGRLHEPSTAAGLAALVALFAPGLAEMVPDLLIQVGQVLGGLAAVFAIVMKEGARDG